MPERLLISERAGRFVHQQAGRVGFAAFVPAPALVPLLGRPDPSPRLGAVEALGSDGVNQVT